MMTPKKIGPYEVKAELGRGGMATVYRAYDPRVDREVAIKVLPRELLHDPQFQVRFDREIKLVAKLEHPAIVPIYDVGDIDGQPYFVMRLMTGGTLSDWIKKGGFSLEDTARIIERLASGLAYAHKKGIIHRDLKPGNVIFDQNGDPYLSDFGVAKFTSAAQDVTGSAVIGTPAYMSPEQAQSVEVDSRSDVYGLGAIIYEMLSGVQPYSAETPMGVVVKHITEPVPEILETRSDLPPAVDTIIKTAMAKDREERYATTTELANALKAVAAGEEPEGPVVKRASAPTTPRRSTIVDNDSAPQPPRRPGKLLVLVLLGVVAIAALGGLYLFRDRLPFAQPPVTEAPTLTPQPSPVPDTPLPPPAIAVEASAPVCQPSLFECELPTVDLLDRFCTNKVPYSLLALPENATFESTHPDLVCISEKVRDGKLQVSCSGPQLRSYDLKVCNPACSGPTLTVDPARCPQPNHGYSFENDCCAPLPPAPPAGAPQLEPGCTIFQVDLRGCN